MGEKHCLIFEEIKKAVARIAQIIYYEPHKDTRVKCDASHSGLGATLRQSTDGEDWIPIAFASRYLIVQGKNIQQTNSNCWQWFGQWLDLNIFVGERMNTSNRS